MHRLASVILMLFSSATQAASWHVPHPWRAEAAVQGRSADYGHERFLHLFSYRSLIDLPGPLGEGVRGSGGSLDSDTLYYDFRFARQFVFDNPRQAFTLDIQRSEDYDGSFDRQLVGLQQQVADHWTLSLRGDVFADKAGSDIYFGARYGLDGGAWLDLQYVLTDAYFNDKTASDSRYETSPQTLFLQWYQPRDGGHTLVSANLSPNAELDDREQLARVRGRQHRLAMQHWQTIGNWQWRLDLTHETTHRRHWLDELTESQAFDREADSATVSVHWPQREHQPHVGVHYLRLKETGWFGRANNASGRVSREEPLVFAGMHWPLKDQQWLTPTVYLSKPRVRQDAMGDWKRREEDEWIGKLALPWHIRVGQAQQAILTLSPSFRLHRFAFGGGNLQFHWPL